MSFLTLFLPAAFFNRRSKADWLEELADIREEALSGHDGEVAHAMGETESLEPVGEAGPTDGASDHRAGADKDGPAVPVADVGGTSSPAELPQSASEASEEWDAAAQPSPPAPAPADDVPAGPEPGSSEPVDGEPGSSGPDHAPALAEPAVGPPMHHELVPSELPDQPSPSLPETPMPAATGSAPAAPADTSPPLRSPVLPAPVPVPALAIVDGALLGGPASRPTPHRIRPRELWHPGFTAEVAHPVEVAGLEERVDPADLVEPEAAGDQGDPPGRRRFPRMEPVAPPATGSSTRHDTVEVDVVQGRDVTDEVAVAHDPLPYGVALAPIGSQPPSRPPTDALPPPVDLFALAPRDANEGSGPGATHGSDEAGDQAGLIAGPIARRSSRSAPRRTLFGSQPPSRLTHAAPVPASHTDTPQPLEVAPNGSVDLDRGVVRVPAGETPPVTVDDDGVALAVSHGWCWTALPWNAAHPVRVTLPGGTLAVPPGATALAIIEPDGSTFVAVVAGAATFERPEGPVPLVAGTVVLAPPGGEIQVDRASPEELAREPLLTDNLRLDEAR